MAQSVSRYRSLSIRRSTTNANFDANGGAVPASSTIHHLSFFHFAPPQKKCWNSRPLLLPLLLRKDILNTGANTPRALQHPRPPMRDGRRGRRGVCVLGPLAQLFCLAQLLRPAGLATATFGSRSFLLPLITAAAAAVARARHLATRIIVKTNTQQPRQHNRPTAVFAGWLWFGSKTNYYCCYY